MLIVSDFFNVFDFLVQTSFFKIIHHQPFSCKKAFEEEGKCKR